MQKFYFFFCIPILLGAQELPLQNAYNRTSTSLDGEWNTIIDPYEGGFYDYRYESYDLLENPPKNAFFTYTRPKDKTDLVEYDFDNSETLTVPGDWNTQKEKLLYYEGTIWYKKSFDYSKKGNDNRVFLYFGGANYQADVYLNGKKLGMHIGGFTPFQFEITELIKEKDNFLIVKVDNKRKREAVPTLNTDWWNYGGITRNVKLVETPATYIKDYMLQLNPDNPRQLLGHVRLKGTQKANQKVMLAIPGLKIRETLTTDGEGNATVDLKLKRVTYWSPENPYLYTVGLSTDFESLEDRIGLRTITTKGTQILLNGEPIFLKGICVHEESPEDGRVSNRQEAEQLLRWVQELNGNFVRLAHYPHNEHIIRAADEMGVLVWEENPVYWTILWDNPETYANAKNQLTEVIHRDKNRASVIIWSMANETPASQERLRFLNNLADHTRSMDSTRLISAALEQSRVNGNDLVRTIEDDFAETVDVLSFNQYVGWYDGLPDKAQKISWQIHQDKPVLISEFGGGAKAGYHADKLTRWSEEYQEYLYQESLIMLDKIPQLAGMSPWLLMDFRSPRRPLAKIQDGYNRKGLVSDKGEKKKAFYVLQRYYQKKN